MNTAAQEAPAGFKNKLNIYTCEKCRGHIVTRDVDDGTTPFLTGCRVTPGCDGMMKSSMYRVFDQSMRESHQRHRPSSLDGLSAHTIDHVKHGGLILREAIIDGAVAGPHVVILGTGRSASVAAAIMAGAEPRPISITDEITATPALTGPAGRAWLCDLAAARTRNSVAPENDATLASWVIEAGWAHPAWHSYSIVLVHLRPMPDKRETKFYLEGATHEFWLHALDPQIARQRLVDGEIGGGWLTPGNFSAQIKATNDAHAMERVESAVRMIVDGNLSPDTDFMAVWAALFGDNMMKKRG